MPLLDLWQRTPEQIRDKRVHQLIAFCGDGKLTDGGTGSTEFRTFLSHISTDLLSRYAEDCLAQSFADSGLALQDCVNELGARLGASVTPGRYRGVQGQPGFDGVWLFPDGFGIIVEVKTTDTYRIDLNKVAAYRSMLVAGGKVSLDQSSVLIVVGRQDTGDLEAQVRGSRFAWDIRLVSIDALFHLLRIKEEVDDPEMMSRIHQVLRPREFTRLDDIVDLLFRTAEDVRQEDPEPPPVSDVPAARLSADAPKFVPVAFHQPCIERLEQHFACSLVRRSRSTFTSPDGSHAVTCIVSKEHNPESQPNYWFAFHPHQRDFLRNHPNAFAALGCGSPRQVLLVPAADFLSWIEGMWITQRDDRFYWHVVVYRDAAAFILHRKKGEARVDLTKYVLP